MNFNERQRVSIIEKVYFYIFICETFWKGSYQVDLERQSIIDKTRITLISVKSSLAEHENFLMMAQSPPGLVRGAMVFDEPRFLLNLLSLNCIKGIRNKWKQFKVFRNLIGPSNSSNLLPISGQCQNIQKFWNF